MRVHISVHDPEANSLRNVGYWCSHLDCYRPASSRSFMHFYVSPVPLEKKRYKIYIMGCGKSCAIDRMQAGRGGKLPTKPQTVTRTPQYWVTRLKIILNAIKCCASYVLCFVYHPVDKGSVASGELSKLISRNPQRVYMQATHTTII